MTVAVTPTERKSPAPADRPTRFSLPGVLTTPALVVIASAVLRNTMVGLHGIDRSLIDAGRGMGLTKTAVLVRVELPLAVPVMLAGLRVALILNVGSATLATFTNAGGLGELINTGIVLNRT